MKKKEKDETEEVEGKRKCGKENSGENGRRREKG